MKVGNIVKHKTTNEYGVVQYSFAGASIHFYDEENNALGKTLGSNLEAIKENWEVCIQMPEGYEWDDSGLFIKKK